MVCLPSAAGRGKTGPLTILAKSSIVCQKAQEGFQLFCVVGNRRHFDRPNLIDDVLITGPHEKKHLAAIENVLERMA